MYTYDAGSLKRYSHKALNLVTRLIQPFIVYVQSFYMHMPYQIA